jgi:hypothetical protein
MKEKATTVLILTIPVDSPDFGEKDSVEFVPE